VAEAIYLLRALDYARFIRKLEVPPGVAVPARLTYEDLVATVLGRECLEEDVRGINASLDLIRRTRGGDWPDGPVTEDFDFVDLVWHELEFRDGQSFSYVVRDVGGTYVGCCYLYPMGHRTELSDELLDHDVDVSWWVTPDAYERGAYTTLYRALRHWLAEELPFRAPYWSNREIPAD
jgi:RimJ/RimL family protein N-acetyltransferase